MHPSVTVPPGRLYLIALDRKFKSKRFRCVGLAKTSGCWMTSSPRKTFTPQPAACDSTSCTSSEFIAFTLSGAFTSVISPLSSLLVSRTSFTRLSSKVDASQILRRHCAWRSKSSGHESPISTMPRMPLMGVRMSWLIRWRNTVLALLASCAAWADNARRSLYSFSRLRLCS